MSTDRKVSGSTLRNWMDFIEKEYGEEVLERIMEGMEPESKAELGDRVSISSNYTHEVFDDFCRGVVICCDGYEVGIELGRHSATEVEDQIFPIIKSAKGDIDYFLDERFTSIHKLYMDDGEFSFSRKNEGSGIVTCIGFYHNELMCYSNAGYLSKCVEFMDAGRVEIENLNHADDPDHPCEMKIKIRE